MIKRILLAILTLFFLNCKKQQAHQYNTYNGSSEYDIIIPNNTIAFDKSETIVTDERSFREYIDNYDSNLVWLFEVEGNFTNSGNREILVFYQKKNTTFLAGEKRDSIDLVCCFVIDPIGEKVERSHEIPNYGTPPFFTGERNIDTDPMEELGRDVIWLDRRIGCIGDFNENGKEELYFFEAYAIGIDPYIYEFNDNVFIEITDRHYSFARISGVDKENKIIHFNSTSRSSGEFSLIWSTDNKRYEWLSGTRSINLLGN